MFEATVCPAAVHAAARNAVVVDFPFVPETVAIFHPVASSSRASGASASVTRAPITEPSPRPVARDVALAARPSTVAMRVRTDKRPPDGFKVDDGIRSTLCGK